MPIPAPMARGGVGRRHHPKTVVLAGDAGTIELNYALKKKGRSPSRLTAPQTSFQRCAHA